MIKGIYTSVAGMHTAQARQQVLAANLANGNTPGYKSDDVTSESFESLLARIVQPDTPGTGAEGAGRKFDLGQGTLTTTGVPTDMALDGDGFFVLDGPDGPLYTRAGRFSRDAQGMLRSPDGLSVQGSDGQPLVVPQGTVSVGSDGTISAGTPPISVGQVRVVTLDPASLSRAGMATFTSTDAPSPAGARVVSGVLEASNVDVTAVMTSLTMLNRAFEAGREAVQLQNDTLNASVNQVGSLH
jgi:flagellar basal body rod protein FlgG